MTDDPKKLTPAEIAHVVVEVQPVLNLIEQAAAHMGAVRAAAKILPRWHDEIGQHLAYADAAPDFMKAAIFNGIFLEMSKRHGQTPEFWGALAHEMRRRQTERPVAVTPAPTAPVESERRAAPVPEQSAQTPPPPPKAEPRPSPRRPGPQETAAILKVLGRCKETIGLIRGAGMDYGQLSAALKTLGVGGSSRTELSRLSTSEAAKRHAQGKSIGWTLASANNTLEGLSIVYDTLTPKAKEAV